MIKNRRDFIVESAVLLAGLGLSRTGRASSADVSALLEKAEAQIMEADTRDKVLELIATYESVIEIEPQNYEALWSLGRYCGLISLAYPRDQAELEKYLYISMDYCERGLRTNPEFDALIIKGGKVWNACRVTTKREIAALFYWNTTRIGIWKMCMSPLEQLTSLNLLPQTKKIMTRMMELDPEWAGGHPYFAWALFYSALPRLLGGNLKKAEWYFDKAIEAGPNWLYIRHSRAEFFHTKRKDRPGFISDLEWVLAQDPKTADSPYPANVHFQRTAREMLDNIEDYF
jgi:tetratricopeptide (TPR) repeat protein